MNLDFHALSSLDTITANLANSSIALVGSNESTNLIGITHLASAALINLEGLSHGAQVVGTGGTNVIAHEYYTGGFGISVASAMLSYDEDGSSFNGGLYAGGYSGFAISANLSADISGLNTNGADGSVTLISQSPDEGSQTISGISDTLSSDVGLTGSAGNDTFSILNALVLGATNSLNHAFTLQGGGGTDTLVVNDANDFNGGPTVPAFSGGDFQYFSGIQSVQLLWDADGATSFDLAVTASLDSSDGLSGANSLFLSNGVQVIDASNFTSSEGATFDFSQVSVLTTGTPQDLTIVGGAGNDTLIGAYGNFDQTLDGGLGTNVITGNLDTNEQGLTSGAHDVYVVHPGATDTIIDPNGYVLMPGITLDGGSLTWDSVHNLPTGSTVSFSGDTISIDAHFGGSYSDAFITIGIGEALTSLPLGVVAFDVTASDDSGSANTVVLGGGDNVITWVDPSASMADSLFGGSPFSVESSQNFATGNNLLQLTGTDSGGLTFNLSDTNQLVGGSAHIGGFQEIDGTGLTGSDGFVSGFAALTNPGDSNGYTLWGSSGGDTLMGGGGTNVLYSGGDSNGFGDTLIGGVGVSAQNTFVVDGFNLTFSDEGSGNPAVILNFNPNKDTLDIPIAENYLGTATASTNNLLYLANDTAAESYAGTSAALLIVGSNTSPHTTDVYLYGGASAVASGLQSYQVAVLPNMDPSQLTASHVSFQQLQSHAALPVTS